MRQKRIVAPTEGLATWQRFLAEPDKHWQPGFSAMCTASTWEKANGVPPEIIAVFSNADCDALRNAQLALAVPEYKVELDGGGQPSQSDVFALLTCGDGLIAMTVEGKAREDFDVTLEQWYRRTSEQGARARMAQILGKIKLAEPIPATIRYQLLHRTASAVIEASRFHAKHAVMLVQSFVRDDSENHFGDFVAFVKLYGRTAAKNALIELGESAGNRLYAAWVESEVDQWTPEPKDAGERG